MFHLYTGKEVDCSSSIISGYDIGEALIESFDGDAAPLKINFKNEYLVARIGLPCLDCVLDRLVVALKQQIGLRCRYAGEQTSLVLSY